MRSDLYQIVLIFLGVIVSALFGVFLYREIFPEYRIYQKDYVALEEFRSTYTGQPPPEFQFGVKQIVILNPEKGPEKIDRCISCHVALQLPDFSPTKLAYDVNGNLKLDERGWPLKIPNENYVFLRLDQKIKELGDSSEADRLKALKTAQVGDHTYDVAKVLQMHPLIGRETRPFEYHPLDDYGCASCHGGNGRGLTTDKAHGPVFDGTYEVEFMGPRPQFLERDYLNDPQFATVFNSKPGNELLFQTTPILVGSLMQAKCVQCHQSSEGALINSVSGVQVLAKRGQEKAQAINTGFEREKEELLSLWQLQDQIKREGLEKTEEQLKKQTQNYSLSAAQIKAFESQLSFLKAEAPLERINRQIAGSLGSPGLAGELEKQPPSMAALDKFLEAHLNDDAATGTIFVKLSQINLEEAVKQHIKDTEKTFSYTASDQKVINSMQSDIDYLTAGYHQGKSLFLSQACYACHRISGFARGGVGPELTNEGAGYPWYIKEKIVWPQWDLKTSTMPNYHLDHEELEGLVTYLLGQRSDSQVKSATEKKIAIQQWEQGKKLPWEKPVTPVEMKDLRFAMTVFATEGCAACHRLKGFESDAGFKIEKGAKPPFSEVYKEKQWFSQLFPEEIKGSDIVKAIDQHAKEIDERIVDGVRKDSLLEEIDAKFPDTIESYYSNFKYAFRAKNYEFTEKVRLAKNPVEKAKALAGLEAWKKRVKRVLLVYIQEYGLGRLVGPRPNWSGIYRSDEELMEHFRNPGSTSARSIMPAFPFDDTKFYALINMLDQLSVKNRNEVDEIWKLRGFDPQTAVKIYCAQCHGEFLEGNGPVAEWIYPIPKNLRNAQFMRNLTKERVVQAIIHGVHGTPMPPWGEVATDKPTADGIPVITRDQANQIVDWLFATLPGSQIIRSEEEVPKWQYSPEKVLEELREEGNYQKLKKGKLAFLPTGHEYYAALNPTVPNSSVDDVFDKRQAPVPGEEKYGYYIKKEYYTPENLLEGKQFFEMNCAACHGAEGEGSGQRAEFLKEAKPRMLTNLNWIETRDDLRLLRSIKFGVPGTAMTPWGDLTSSLQRMQLVMFIRTLSEEPERRNKLFNALYQGFNRSDRVIEEARVGEYKKMELVQVKIGQTHQMREELARSSPEKAGEAYAQEIKLQERLAKFRLADQLLNDLKEEVKREREIYQNMGVSVLSKMTSDAALENMIKIIRLNDGRYTLKEGRLEFNWSPEKEEQISRTSEELIREIGQSKRVLEQEKIQAEGKISSAEREVERSKIDSELAAYQKLEHQIAAGLGDAKRSVQKQQAIYQQYQKKQAELNDEVQ